MRRTASILTLVVALGLACTPEPPSDLTGPPPTFSITLAWDPPTTDATGAPLVDLASYRLYYGPNTPITRDNSTMVEAGSQPTFTLTGLEAGLYYLAVSALDHDDNESELSAEVSTRLGAN
jgi:hypothetical protein